MHQHLRDLSSVLPVWLPCALENHASGDCRRSVHLGCILRRTSITTIFTTTIHCPAASHEYQLLAARDVPSLVLPEVLRVGLRERKDKVDRCTTFDAASEELPESGYRAWVRLTRAELHLEGVPMSLSCHADEEDGGIAVE